MADNVKVSDDELVSIVMEEVGTADFEGTSQLQAQRAEADLAYTSEFTQGTEPNTGMSSIIINAYQPAVDTLTTYVSNAVNEKRKAVVFQADAQEYNQAAAQITDVLNDCVYKKNSGYSIINRWIKDAFLHKTAIVKTYWDTTPEYYKFHFEGTDGELAVAMAEKEAEGWTCEVMDKEEITEIAEIEVEGSDEILEVSTSSITATIKCSKPANQPRIMNIAPEEFLINEGAVSLDRNDPTLRFACHRQLRSKSDIQAMIDSDDRFDQNIDVDELGSASSGSLSEEYEMFSRHAFDGTYWYDGGNQSSQGLLQEIQVIEYWVRADRDGDGVAEWRHGFIFGSTLGMDEEHFGAIPLHSYTPFAIPHKFYGLGLWDKLRDYHRTKTGLVRAAIDTANQKNTHRFFADPRKIDTRALKSGKPGIIPTLTGFDPRTDIMPVPTPTGSAGEAVALLQYLDAEIAAQIGIDPKTGVVSADIEKSGNDAAKTAQAIDAASTKIEALVREFAETGLRDMVWALYDLYVQWGYLPEGLKKSELVAKVGLGYQTQQQKVAGAQAVLQQQAALEASPVSPTAIPYKYKQNASMELTKALGFDDAYKFFPTPEEVQAEQQRQAQAAAQAQQAQLAAMQTQQQDGLANSEAKRRLEEAQAKKAEIEANAAERKQQLEEEAKVVDIQNIQEDNRLNEERHQAQIEQMAANLELQKRNEELQRELAELKAVTSIEVAEIQADARVRDNKNLKKDAE